ncbi:hypothetical protein NE237_026853 [Protea cynaroides]|uniref:Serpin domain-containing protein n=1 Tax=Protea cynaroides TaxID=273540 RepID=A0A9Q0GN77_9MAGN|nr:hypothetical protein NE237_026853 [Protea cynaroides]
MDLQQLITNQTDFSLEIAKSVLLKEAKDSNVVFSPLSVHVVLSLIVVFSPLSVHVVLSLIVAGSKGPTLDQILSFLRSKSNGELNSFASETVSLVLADGSQSGGPRLSSANGVWIDKLLSLKASFKDIIDNVYKAVSIQVDFQTKLNQTHLCKCTLFQGNLEKFDASETKDYDFYLLDEGSVHVPFMTSKKKQFVCAYDGFKVFLMYIFLPDTKDRLPALVEKVASEPGFLDRHLPSEAVQLGDFRIPRFKISFGFEVSKVLKGLGLVFPFSGGLTEMVDSILGKNLCVSSVFRKSYIEVNEEGTEASTFRV